MTAEPAPWGVPSAEDEAELRESFGAVLAATRTAVGLSQYKLARAAGVNRSTVNRLERGHRRPRASMIIRLARGVVPNHPDGLAHLLHDAAGDLLAPESVYPTSPKHRRRWVDPMDGAGDPAPLGNASGTITPSSLSVAMDVTP